MRIVCVALLAAACNHASTTVSLPQAVDGALWVDPDVYSTIPLRVLSKASKVSVSLDGKSFDVTNGIAQLSTAELSDGEHSIVATAEGSTAKATLVAGRQGVQLTDFSQVGAGRSPRVHRFHDQLWVTWTDRFATSAKAWLRRIDGAGRWMGERILMVEAPAGDEIQYARTAFGDNSIAVLYQRNGVPYKNWLTIVDLSGKQLIDPIALDPMGADGVTGGDLDFDGKGFVAVWRSIGSSSTLSWIRVDEKLHQVTGPIMVATAGAGDSTDPVGKFEPMSFVSVRAIGDKSLIGFVRERYSAILAQASPRSELAMVQSDGSVLDDERAGDDSYLLWHSESRVFKIGSSPGRAQGNFVPIWIAKDLNDTADNPRNVFYSALAMPTGSGTKLIDAADDRDEPFLMEHPEKLGVLAWLDHRNWDQKGIQLYVAGVKDDLSAEEPAIFPHARFVADTSELNAAPAGTNAILMWSDERHGMGISDPKPEVYFETAWF
jgi:hypothetical protein